MGCCMSNCSFFEKETIYEVVLDANGVAQRVSKGQGTHFIHVSPHKETVLKEKSEITYPSPTYQNKSPSLIKPPMYEHRRIQPLTKV
ncbi:hypothetical protein G6F57_005034 [Rhizopus arrhizus]|uniref:Uncharacterized protein n=1 Tax=Rhizopus oryzae TaxID=64495 RepID=A0A9P7BMH2_RHIOR|nr:hypothetical protein G6F23_010850 [Rhizopus arrhizus]KAG1428024.1 hypothetical protein G6F58_000759 [Rhizopus delemar]KAG0765323.1 hypothetical protein G6F24_004518 [Rhizopus arrhizus]KAG0795883.1 hypothetical protein G6F21_001758 [Rhizopus arrhizus]KAG0800480.1 hypothetical protein G6F22_002187 [Rhizopus arrhizus]